MSSRTFIGTRSFAVKGRLLSRSALETLAESTSLDELVNRLKATPYSEVVSKVQPQFTARKLELAFRERLADVHYALMKSASSFEIFELYYLRNNVAWDVKSAIKAKALGKSYDETIEFLDVHSEELIGRREVIAKVLAAKDVQEAVQFLSGTEFGPDLEKALAAYQGSGEIRFFDIYVDHAILTMIAKAYSRNFRRYSSKSVEKGGVGELVALDIDSYNVLSVLRAKLWKLPANEIRSLVIQPTFRYSLPNLTRLMEAESVGEALKLLRPEHQPAQQGTTSEEEAIAYVEDAFALESMRSAQRAFIWQGLGPADALALIKLLEIEVKNLAAISIGVEAKMQPRDIVAKLRL